VFWFCVSSRRRHTRAKRDWSSDVCSSDLLYARVSSIAAVDRNADTGDKAGSSIVQQEQDSTFQFVELTKTTHGRTCENLCSTCRSEERRVGEECRCG